MGGYKSEFTGVQMDAAVQFLLDALNGANQTGLGWLSGYGAPSNALGSNGCFYLRIDNGDVHKKTNGAWGDPILNVTNSGGGGGSATLNIGVTVDGAGKVVTTGNKGFRTIPTDAVLVGWQLIADREGSVEFEVSLATSQGFPLNTPITGTTKPNLVNQQINQSTDMIGWTVDLPIGSIIGFEILSVSTVQRVMLALTIITVPAA